jgi:hypothetical protein
MTGWKDMLLDVLRLTDEVKRMNRDIDRVESTLLNVDAQAQGSQPRIEPK